MTTLTEQDDIVAYLQEQQGKLLMQIADKERVIDYR